MTLFIKTLNRLLIINDAYVMALAFIVSYTTVQVIKRLAAKRSSKDKGTKVYNVRGGSFDIGTSDDSLDIKISNENKLEQTILTCIEDGKNYVVTDPTLKRLIFNLVREKITNKSLIFTSNMIRLVALKLINNKQHSLVKIRTAIISTDNTQRMGIRALGAIIIGRVCSIFANRFILPLKMFYQALMIIISYQSTQTCGYKCENYFKYLPQESPVSIFENESTGNIVIAGNDKAPQVEIYIPTETFEGRVTSPKIGHRIIRQTYKKSPRKTKEVKFSEFRKTDPVLSQFRDLEEPVIPNQPCIDPIFHELFDRIPE